MARMGNKKGISGLVGNIVFRTQNGAQIIQSRASNIKQTPATKRSASEFGSCSIWAKQLRIALSSFLVELTDSTMHSRFSAAVYDGVKTNLNLPIGQRTPLNSSMDNLIGFEFNSHSYFDDYFKVSIDVELTLSNEVKVTIPAFNPSEAMVFPESCNTAELMLFVYATTFDNTANDLSFHTLLPLEKNTPLPTTTVWTSPSIPENYFVLVSAKLLYYNPNPLTVRNYLNSKTFSPAMVVMAKTVGN